MTATAGANSAALTWAHPDNLSTNPVQTYQYQYKTAGAAYGAWTNTILTGKSAAISLTVSNLAGNVAHTFRVRGVNLYNDPGPASDEITVTPTGAPAAPTSLSHRDRQQDPARLLDRAHRTRQPHHRLRIPNQANVQHRLGRLGVHNRTATQPPQPPT